MKVLHVVPSLRPSGGGTSRSVASFVQAQRLAGLEVMIAASGVTGDGDLNICHFPARFAIPTPRSCWALLEAIGRSDLVEIHSLWNGTSTMAAALCRRVDVPYVLTPHGMVDPVCLRVRRVAKRLYGRLVERKTLRGARAFHFLSEDERDRGVVGRTLSSDEVVVSPNGAPELPDAPLHRVLARRFGTELDRRVVLHLGRLHPIKGIDLQIRALHHIPEPERPLLLLVGPDYGAWRQLKRQACLERVENWVRWGGEIYGDERFGLLAEADLVLLTSVYDCNPVVAVEAMAVGAAVLATDSCGLTGAAESGAAIVVPRRPEDIALAIRGLLADRNRLATLRQRARRYAGAELSSSRLLQPLLELYERIVATSRPRHSVGR